MYDLNNKITLITGATSGIGRAVAENLARNGARLALTGRDESKLKELQAKLLPHHSWIHTFRNDLSEPDTFSELIRAAEEKLNGSIQILIHAAGVASLGYVEDVPLEAFIHDLQINFLATVRLSQLVIPRMKSQREGRILSVVSGVAFRGMPGVAPYCASKGALQLFMESLRVELRPYGIRVISFSPGPVDTAFYQKQKVYGSLKETFAPRFRRSPVWIAERIKRALEHGAPFVEVLSRSTLLRHINYWSPSLVDWFLSRKICKGLKQP